MPVNAAGLVRDEQNAACLGEIEGIVDAGDEPEFPSRLQERSPFAAVENHEDVDVLGESRPPQNRGGDSTDDHAGDSGRIEPFRHRAERLDERCRRVSSPPGRSTLCQSWPF